MSDAPQNFLQTPLHGALVGTQRFITVCWTTDRDEPFLLCKNNTPWTRRMTRGLNWSWEAERLEHTLGALCPVCVSVFLRVNLANRRCHSCTYRREESQKIVEKAPFTLPPESETTAAANVAPSQCVPEMEPTQRKSLLE